MPKIALTGTMTLATAADRALVNRLLPDHIRLTRAEPGCLLFQVAPSAADPAILEVRELFESHDAFQAHQRRARSSAWGRATADLRRDYRIEQAD